MNRCTLRVRITANISKRQRNFAKQLNGMLDCKNDATDVNGEVLLWT
jgi:hypothetical protein